MKRHLEQSLGESQTWSFCGLGTQHPLGTLYMITNQDSPKLWCNNHWPHDWVQTQALLPSSEVRRLAQNLNPLITGLVFLVCWAPHADSVQGPTTVTWLAYTQVWPQSPPRTTKIFPSLGKFQELESSSQEPRTKMRLNFLLYNGWEAYKIGFHSTIHLDMTNSRKKSNWNLFP